MTVPQKHTREQSNTEYWSFSSLRNVTEPVNFALTAQILNQT